MNFCFDFLQELSMVWEAISNIRKGVHPISKHLEVGFKKTWLRLVFSTTSRCLDIGWNTFPHVWYITWNCSIYDYQPNPKCLSWTTVLKWLVITDLCCSNNITLKLANQLISRAWLTTRLKNNSSLHSWKIASGQMVGKSIIGRITRTWMIGKLGLGGELLY